MRQIVLDTETTGLSPQQGHRIVEIGCVELNNRRLTGNTFHFYLQPDRKVDIGAIQVHGITDEFLIDKPRFKEIANAFKEFIMGAELIIHNAAFDVGFIENEFTLLKDKSWQTLSVHCTIIDTLLIARQKHPGQRNNLDALCKRYAVDNQHREKHGALLDAEILAEVYLAMTGGQNTLLLGEEENSPAQTTTVEQKDFNPALASFNIPVIKASEAELAAHEDFLKALDKKFGEACLWRSCSKPSPD